MELIRKYFPELSSVQLEQFRALQPLYEDWNAKINVISRKDIEHLYMHHVLHSLALAKVDVIRNGMHIIDAGTGGGFPGIPLTIYYPEVKFTLVDSTAKKIHVVNEVIQSLSLKNAKGIHARLEDHRGQYDLLTSRAVSTLTQLALWTKSLNCHHWLVLKGGDPKEIRKELPPRFTVNSISVQNYFEENYFEGKFIVEVNLRS